MTKLLQKILLVTGGCGLFLLFYLHVLTVALLVVAFFALLVAQFFQTPELVLLILFGGVPFTFLASAIIALFMVLFAIGYLPGIVHRVMTTRPRRMYAFSNPVARKEKAKYRPAASWSQRSLLFLTLAGLFGFNMVCLLLPVHFLTLKPQFARFGDPLLFVLAMLFTYLGAHLYYRLVRWLKRQGVDATIAFFLWGSIDFIGMCCVLTVLMNATYVMCLMVTGYSVVLSDGLRVIVSLLSISPQVQMLLIWLSMPLIHRWQFIRHLNAS